MKYRLDKNFLKGKKCQRTIFLIKYIYENISSGGGAMHIVLDDGNIESHNIQYCIDESIPEIKSDVYREVYNECAELLLEMSEMERGKVLNASFK